MPSRKQKRFLGRTMKIHKVNKTANIKIKPHGIQYSIEPVEVLSNDPNMKGDIIKKHVNGKLVQQKFITYGKSKKIIDKQANKLKNLQKGGKLTEKQKAQLEKLKQLEAEELPGKTEIVYKDDTGFVRNAKNTAGAVVGAGAGIAFNMVVAGAVARAFGDSSSQ